MTTINNDYLTQFVANPDMSWDVGYEEKIKTYQSSLLKIESRCLDLAALVDDLAMRMDFLESKVDRLLGNIETKSFNSFLSQFEIHDGEPERGDDDEA